MKPGIYTDLSNEAYHNGPGVSKSVLDLVRRSPAHAKFAMDARKNQANDNSTAVQKFGSAFHAAVLEPAEYEAHWIAAPDIDRRTKAGRDAWAEFQETNAGKLIISASDMAQIEDMRSSVYAHPAAMALLDGDGLNEVSFYWIDQDTGELCRCRADRWRRDLNVIIDLKTTVNASPEHFARSIVDYRYYVQSAMYLDGVEAATGIPQTGFVFIAIEKSPPYSVGVYAINPTDVDIGRQHYKADLEVYAKCRAENNWPAYGNRIVSIELPGWFSARYIAAQD